MHFNPDVYSSNLYSLLGHTFCQSIQQAAPKRQAEFLAGRHAARKSLAQLGLSQRQILVGKNRAPIWPCQVIGSISHTDRIAACAAIHAADRLYLGLDLENWLTTTVATDICNNIVSPAEHKRLQATGFSIEQALTITFSAKESLFKALYPFVGDYFGFEAAEILHLDPKTGKIEMVLCQTLSADCRSGQIIYGYFQRKGWGVQTLVYGSL
ncbi:4'-phosphopantetheinyl transferase superfamily protein [Rheinheimera baltica]|uniref:4'-phosphopantetheinyl transferase family protein n=1 Tax=Rheinheimera baltica TaxID=67576 RepID=UPI00274020E3|nr:4'-phosphopantetheinyl transferase superfamily protein [Rheinheimera baltica]MDP5142179.1 4'-phosphopantetheinyl transferase superfamily protein [Rheinheimera baltica]